MNFRKAIGLALIPAIIFSLTSCGKGTDSSIEFEKRAYQIDCESSGVAGGGTLWQGLIWFGITKNTGPAFEFVDSENTEVSNADFNWEITNYNFSFDLLDKDGNKVASSSRVEGSSGGVGVTFTPIKGSSQISLLSLQKGFGSEQLDACSFKDRFVSCQDQVNDIWDFLETAAIIANCDLVVTSDTSVAHLAGGMGKTTWLLLHKVPDWRWGLEGDTTFWYPSMRLFRQRERGNWDEVMERVAEALQEHFRG